MAKSGILARKELDENIFFLCRTVLASVLVKANSLETKLSMLSISSYIRREDWGFSCRSIKNAFDFINKMHAVTNC